MKEGWGQAEPEFEPNEPYRNPLRGVGRHDPCPCDSGKRLQYCCLTLSR